MRIGIDTNILIHLTNQHDPLHKVVTDAWRELKRQDHVLCAAPQNLIEFWNVCTRPSEGHRGLGLKPVEVAAQLASLEAMLEILPEDSRIYDAWRELVLKHAVRGKQVHDARLAAIYQVYGVDTILTRNGKDFRRFDFLTVMTP